MASYFNAPVNIPKQDALTFSTPDANANVSITSNTSTLQDYTLVLPSNVGIVGDNLNIIEDLIKNEANLDIVSIFVENKIIVFKIFLLILREK